MNEERISYQLGYDAVGKVQEIDPMHDPYMRPFRPVRERLYNSGNPRTGQYLENRKAWFDGYLDRSVELGGAWAQEAIRAYEKNYTRSQEPGTIPGKRYVLFFEQIDNHQLQSPHRETRTLSTLAAAPPAVARLDVGAGSLRDAIRQGWSVIMGGDTSTLAEVSLLGAYLPAGSADPAKNLLYQYYNAAIDMDASKQKLAAPARQFARYLRNSDDLPGAVRGERVQLAVFKAIERELGAVYRDMTGSRPPRLTDIFMVAYAEDIIRTRPMARYREDVEELLGAFARNGDREPLSLFVYEGVLPGGRSVIEPPVWHWEANDSDPPRDDPVTGHGQSEAKPSVLGRIREAKAAPKPPRKPKALEKRKDGAER